MWDFHENDMNENNDISAFQNTNNYLQSPFELKKYVFMLVNCFDLKIDHIWICLELWTQSQVLIAKKSNSSNFGWTYLQAQREFEGVLWC